jgi:hypothetical protein
VFRAGEGSGGHGDDAGPDRAPAEDRPPPSNVTHAPTTGLNFDDGAGFADA